MIDFVLSYLPLLNLIILNCGLALSQYVVLRAGVFSVATAGLASIGAYTAGLLILRAGVPVLVAVFRGALSGMMAALILSMPLARLRGVFQAIATVAMVQIILSIALYADDITGGANGLNGIPRLVGTPALVLFIAVCIYGLWSLGRGRVGAAFDTIRQDETVAVSLGISVRYYQTLAFGLSGVIAGMTGALMACHNHSIVPEETRSHGLASPAHSRTCACSKKRADNILAGCRQEETVPFYAQALGLPAMRRARGVSIVRAHALLAELGMTEYADRLGGELSYGHQRRVEIMRALALEPGVLLLDEPVAGMNDPEAEELGRIFRKLATGGMAVLLIEHNMRFVAAQCDEIYVLATGELIDHGAPAKVLANPKVVEAYLGVQAC